MTIYEQKNDIENILQNIYTNKKNMIDNVKDLYAFIDKEVFNINHEEDKNVSHLIQKRVDFLASLIIEELKKNLQESEKIEFKISKNNLEIFEPICYILGFKKIDENDEFKFKSLHVNTHLENKNAFIIILDFINGYKLIPWK